MPKKDTASAVLGMLSSAGAHTRPDNPADPEPPTVPAAQPAPGPMAVVDDHDGPSATVSSLPAAPPDANTAGADAPRTLRLRADTAQRLRGAWLEAKRDDVLLTAQDFASDLVDEALGRRRRQRAARSR